MLGKGFVLLGLNRVNFGDATGVGHVQDATLCPWALAKFRTLIMYLVPETRGRADRFSQCCETHRLLGLSNRGRQPNYPQNVIQNLPNPHPWTPPWRRVDRSRRGFSRDVP